MNLEQICALALKTVRFRAKTVDQVISELEKSPLHEIALGTPPEVLFDAKIALEMPKIVEIDGVSLLS